MSWEETNLIHPPIRYWEQDLASWKADGKKLVYLAGTFDPDMPDWRDPVIDILSEERTDERLIVLDPRQSRYEPQWHQGTNSLAALGVTLDPDDAEYERQLQTFTHQGLSLLAEQFDWELRGIQLADQVVFNFEPGCRSPISLLLLGMLHLHGPQVIVRCPPSYWRYEYVAMFCQRLMIQLKPDLADLGMLARYRL